MVKREMGDHLRKKTTTMKKRGVEEDCVRIEIKIVFAGNDLVVNEFCLFCFLMFLLVYFIVFIQPEWQNVCAFAPITKLEFQLSHLFVLSFFFPEKFLSRFGLSYCKGKMPFENYKSNISMFK